MATVSGVFTRLAPGIYQGKWTGIKATTSVGTAMVMPRNLETITVQFQGTYASLGKIQLQGTNFGTVTGTWMQLKDWGGTAISASGNQMVRVRDVPFMVRPFQNTGVTAGTLVNVYVVAHCFERS